MNSILEVMQKFSDNKKCKAYLEKTRWNNKPKCPNCKNQNNIYELPNQNYKCSSCKKKFNVLIGTIFENTKIPLQKWFIAIYLATSHKKGISSLQLSKDISITQKSAWFMLHRIREMLKNKAPEMLDNGVEIDETYIGGKEKNKHSKKKTLNAQGRSTKSKIAVLGMVERKGNIITKTVDSVNTICLTKNIVERVSNQSKIYTDEWLGYNALKKIYSHEVVKHNQGEYVKGKIHTNTIEGFWSILKRGIIGIYHFTSKKHIDRYLNEFSFRCNYKNVSQENRFYQSILQCDSRLKYMELVA